MLRAISYALLCLALLISFTPINYVSAPLRPYHLEILKLTRGYCSSDQFFNPSQQLIYFNRLKGQEIGVCIVRAHSFTVQIDPIYWLTSDENAKWELMYHELAHCFLLKNHVDNPENYLYPYAVGLNKEEVTKQFIEDLKEHCHGK